MDGQKKDAYGEASSSTSSTRHREHVVLTEDGYGDGGVTSANHARHARRKFDLVVVPFVTMFYFLNFLDRSNIGNARTSGLQRDLKITNYQYSLALTVTYIPYIIAELPSNLLLKKFGPNILLPLYVSLWGLVTLLQGFVTSYSGLIACRFFLGLFEGGLLPGILLYLSSFYLRHELQTRVALLFTATSLAGAFSSLLAFGISHLDGKGGKAGWSWIFFLEGAFTVLFGIFSAFFMPASPRTARFLSEDERAAAINALKADWTADEEHEVFRWKDVGSAFLSPQVMLMAVMFFFNGTTLFGLAYFAPNIVNALGYSSIRSQLMTVPPYAAAFVVSLLMALASDKYRARGVFTILSGVIAAAGYGLFLGTNKKSVAYGALFLQVSGAYVSAPTLSAWNANNVMPHYRRASAVAIGFIMTNLGGILSTWIFTSPPRYHKATLINLIFSLGIILFASMNMLYLSWKNKTRTEEREGLGEVDGEARVGYDEDRKRLGDRHRDFVYTL